MQKLYSLSALMLAIVFSMPLAHAEQNDTPTVDYIQHVVVNNCFVDHNSWIKIRYELTEPTGVIHKGHIYPSTDIINLDQNTSKILSGVYTLHFSFCGGSIAFPKCHSYSASANIQHNANVIWDLSCDGIKVNQTDL
ncbi:MAG: hypothetical protein NXI01_02300 [Gammaproteobacteria bacterium]|nr:hypothetical protein [Gammaproteobacteria bacterium]